MDLGLSGVRADSIRKPVGPASSPGSVDEVPAPRFDHLLALTGEYGLYEHALLDRPRLDHGYTTDDNARALVVLSRCPPSARPDPLPYLRFVISARVPFGWHNRMWGSGAWGDRRGSDDAHGRAVWGLGEIMAAGVLDDDVAAAFLAGLDLRSTHLRPNCYAALGAVASLRGGVVTVEGERFLERLAGRLPRPEAGAWTWPEPRLTYANGRIPQAMIEVGATVGDPRLVEDGLELLAWLVAVESGGNGLSFTPVGGRGPGDSGPAFDQQPVEVWAMADACFSASRVDGSPSWEESLRRCVMWLIGENDSRQRMYDSLTGAGFDGLEPGGRNMNRGAESTLSALGTLALWHWRGYPVEEAGVS